MKIGATYLTKGLDMNCHAVTVRVRLVELLETPIVHPGRGGRPDTVLSQRVYLPQSQNTRTPRLRL